MRRVWWRRADHLIVAGKERETEAREADKKGLVQDFKIFSSKAHTPQ
jgi:hypothetical protein